MTPLTALFERHFQRLVFPADATREELRTLCRAMFDAGRRSHFQAPRQLAAVVTRKAHKDPRS